MNIRMRRGKKSGERSHRSVPRQDVLLLPGLAGVRQHRRHRDLVGRRQRHQRDQVRDDVDVGVQRVDRRVRAVREQRPQATQARLDEPAIVAQKTVE